LIGRFVNDESNAAGQPRAHAREIEDRAGRAHASACRRMSDVNCMRYQPGLPVNYLSEGIKSGSAHRGVARPTEELDVSSCRRDPSIQQPKTMDGYASHHPSSHASFTLRSSLFAVYYGRQSAIPIPSSPYPADKDAVAITHASIDACFPSPQKFLQTSFATD